MTDREKIRELESQVSRDERRYDQIDLLKAQLLQNISEQGFQTASTEGRYRDKKQELMNSIRRTRELLAGIRTQPD